MTDRARALALSVLYLLGIACTPTSTRSKTIPTEATAVTVDRCDFSVDASDTHNSDAVASQLVPVAPLDVNKKAFVSDPNFPDCVHPGVTAQCSSGWCRIPAGCFIYGTPEGTPWRAAVGEEQGPITLTYDMEAMQTELTWKNYTEMTGWARTITPGDCGDEDCPAKMSWWEAMLFANTLSEAHEPPLESCYELGDGCTAEPGNRMYCPNYKLTRPGHSCEVYRLPNQFEWQYLARGGTTTDFYTGNMLDSKTLDCIVDPALEKIAWYCGNSKGSAAHSVGLMSPNQWGLYDTLGNVLETLQTLKFPAPGVPATDPEEPDATEQRLTDGAGGNATSAPVALHVARRMSVDFAGLRLVRTLGPGVLPQLQQ